MMIIDDYDDDECLNDWMKMKYCSKRGEKKNECKVFFFFSSSFPSFRFKTYRDT